MPTQTPTQPTTQPTALDPKIVTLAKAIRQTESDGNFQAKGKSGEYGAYQFMPSTWAGTAPKYGVSVPLDQATPQQQNEVAYKQLSDWSKEHPDWNVGNFASAWNAGPGKPNAYLEGNSGTNSKGVSYDTAAYAQKVAQNYQQFKAQGGQTPTPQAIPDGTTQAPSVGGFLGNVVSSGANFIGNTAEALLHPIDTIQNLGGTAVGAFQELGGQTNDNTAKFDNLKNYFTQKYGGVSNIEHAIYTDPIGVAGDLAAIFSAGGGAVGALGKLGELGGLETAADVAKTASSALGKAAEYTNPLTPVAKGITALTDPLKAAATYGVTKAANIEDSTARIVQENKAAITPEAINNADYTRAQVAKEVETAFQAKEAEFSDTGAAYKPLKESITPITVAPNFLEDQLRAAAGVEVKDGQIEANASSKIRTTKDVNALQQLFNTFKPALQKGTLTPQEFFNLRDDLKNVAKYDREFSASKPVESVAAEIRSKLNELYREQIPGLKELDTNFGTKAEEIKTLRKGLFDKEGNLLPSAINKIANAGGKGKDLLIQQLEEIRPGITKKIQIQKALEDIHDAASKPKVGTYTEAILKGGGMLAGLSTGNIGLIAGSLALAIIGKPGIAIPLLKAFDFDKQLVGEVSNRLAKYVTLGADSANIQTNGQAQQSLDTQPQTPTSPQGNYQSSSQNDITQTPGYQEAIKAGYTPQEIQQYLATVNK